MTITIPFEAIEKITEHRPEFDYSYNGATVKVYMDEKTYQHELRELRLRKLIGRN